MRKFLTALVFVAATSMVAQAQVSGKVVDGKIVLSGSGQKLAGVDLKSAAGNLVPVAGDPASAAPFAFFLANTANQITWGNLGTTYTLEGDWETGAGYNGDPAGDLVSSWGDGPNPVSFEITGAAVDPGPVDPGPIDPGPVDPGPVDPPAAGACPPEGFEGVVGCIEDGIVVIHANPAVNAAGIDLKSDGGFTPVPDPPGTNGFAFFLANTPNQITYGNLGTTTEISVFNTGAAFDGDPASIVASWGDGPNPVAFAVQAAGADPVDPGPVDPGPVDPGPVDPGPVDPGTPVVPEPTSGLLAAFAALGFLGFRKRRN